MKKIVILFLIILSVGLFVIIQADVKDNRDTTTENSMLIKIDDNYFIEKGNSVKHNLFFSESNSETSDYNAESIRLFVERDKYIIKYAFNENYIAYHLNELDSAINDSALYVRTISATEYSVIDDQFVIYDIEKHTKTEFKNQDSFISYCNANSLTLSDWIFVSGIEYDDIVLSEKCLLKMSKSMSVHDQFIYNNKVLLEGYISDYEVMDNVVKFRIRVPHKSFLEFPKTSNSALNIGNDVVGKYMSGLVLFFPLFDEIYFDEVITVNLLTGAVE